MLPAADLDIAIDTDACGLRQVRIAAHGPAGEALRRLGLGLAA